MRHIHRGQSLFEVIIALALFSLLASALISMSLGGLTGLNLGGESAKAEALAQEGTEAVRSVRDGAWNEMASGGTQVALAITGNQWTLAASGSTTIGAYTRGIYLNDVCRTPTGAQVSCPPGGANYTDLHSKRAKVIVSWQTRPGIINSVKKISYITNWNSREWVEDTVADFSDGTHSNTAVSPTLGDGDGAVTLLPQ